MNAARIASELLRKYPELLADIRPKPRPRRRRKMSWEDAEKDSRSSGFVELKKDRDSAVVIFVDGPSKMSTHWDQDEQRGFRCAGPGCDYCRTERPKTRYGFPVYELSSKSLKVLEQGYFFLKDVLALRGEVDLSKQAIKVIRSGTGKDTRWTLVQVQGYSAEHAAIIGALDPLDMQAEWVERKTMAPTTAPTTAGVTAPTDDVPF